MRASSYICAPVLLLALFNLPAISLHPTREIALESENRSKVSAIIMPEAMAALSTQTGTKFISKEGGFSIALPPNFSPFQHKAETQATGVGNIELHTFSSATPTGFCVLGYSDFPPVSFQGRSAQKILEDGRDGALKNANGILEKQKSITLQEYPGLSIYGSAGPEGKRLYFRFDFVLVQPRAYQIGYLAYDKADLDKPEVQSYFNSFHLEK